MILGILAGIIFKSNIMVIAPLGKIFVNLLRMAAMPLIVVNLIAGIASMSDARLLGRVGVKIFIYYFLTTVCALIIGLVVAGILKTWCGICFAG